MIKIKIGQETKLKRDRERMSSNVWPFPNKDQSVELPGTSLEMFKPCLFHMSSPICISHFLLLKAFQVRYPPGNVSTNLIFSRQSTEDMSHVWGIPLDLNLKCYLSNITDKKHGGGRLGLLVGCTTVSGIYKGAQWVLITTVHLSTV